MPEQEFQTLIEHAIQGDRNAIGKLLDRHRPYLKMLTQRANNGKIQARVDDSDLVQQTCLSAIRAFNKFEGNNETQFIMWLRKIHERNIKDNIRKHIGAGKRSILQEQSLAEEAPPKGLLHPNTLSPSQRMMQAEESVRLAEAMMKLTHDQREAVRLRHLEGWTLSQLEEHFERSEAAVASLIKRGLENLRKQYSGKN
ncbi:MAG: sigma-70 family RNA polymerase sigma factor [Planctomycetaceae bacterium]|nr:sigma-70 family RNA polymerase sigma factor [Planctomycetaceae bacterium]